MSESRRDLLRWQFDFTWLLFEHHARRLSTEDFLWEPASRCWTMRRDAEGGWTPDWEEPEPDPPPIPTVAWISWHIGWWWSVTLDHAQARHPRTRAEIRWPGPGEATVRWLRALRAEWVGVLDRLDDADLDAPAPFPWQDDPERTVAQMLGWVNAELMKNVTEIGQLHLLRTSS